MTTDLAAAGPLKAKIVSFPDDLLEIIGFYVNEVAWISLVRVCREYRYFVSEP